MIRPKGHAIDEIDRSDLGVKVICECGWETHPASLGWVTQSHARHVREEGGREEEVTATMRAGGRRWNTGPKALVVLVAILLVVFAFKAFTGGGAPSEDEMASSCQSYLSEYVLLDPEGTRFPETNWSVYEHVEGDSSAYEVAGIMVTSNPLGGKIKKFYRCWLRSGGDYGVYEAYSEPYDETRVTNNGK